MGIIKQLTSSLCASNWAVLLLSLGLLFQIIVFLLNFSFSGSRYPNYTQIPSVYFPRFSNKSWEGFRGINVGTIYHPSVSTDSQPHDRSNKYVNPPSSQTLRLDIVPTSFAGLDDFRYPLDVDMPDIVRRVLLNLSVPVNPINRPHFKLLIANEDKCKQMEADQKRPVELLILIKSAPDHFVQRDAIRFTWGKERCWGGRLVVRLFLLGAVSVSDQNVSERLDNEALFHKDIIQQDFLDRYYNNTYKMMFGIDWAVHFCPNARLIMFVDDDFFVYPRNVVAFMEGLSDGFLERLVAGFVWRNAKPFRNRRYKSKWWISWDEYSNAEYPTYVAAGHFFLSMHMAKELLIASWYTRYLRFDDVFLGILLRKLLRVPVHLPRIHASQTVNVSSSTQIQTMISSHNFDRPFAIFDMWNRVKGDAFCV